MTRDELVTHIATASNQSQADIERVLTCLEATILDAVKSGGFVPLRVGRFKPLRRAARAERMGRNPRTGEPVQIVAVPARTVLGFVASSKVGSW